MNATLLDLYKTGNNLQKYFTLEKPITLQPLADEMVDTIQVEYDMDHMMVKVSSVLPNGEKNEPVFMSNYESDIDSPFEIKTDQKFLSIAIDHKVKIVEGDFEFPDFFENY